MPWSNEGDGNRKGGGNGGGPWGQGPWGQGGGGGGGQQQPDLDEILRRGQDRVKRVIRGGGSGNGGGGGIGGGGVPKPFLFLIAALVAAAAAFQLFTFRVNPDEQGIVLRFGKFAGWEAEGLHFRWPYPIEEVRLPKVTQQRTIEVGSGVSGRDSGLMLTGDGSVVDIRFVVFWRIRLDRDPSNGQTGVEQFLFNIAQPELTVRDVAESAMREIVGQSELQPLLTAGRQSTQDAVQKLMQATLDSYKAGIQIDQVQLREVDPPQAVIAAFRDVAAAAQDRDRFIKEAQTYRDQIVPRAKGEADRIIEAAEGYREQTVAEAKGQAARFLEVFEQYQKAPDVTRQRLFLEMQEQVLSGADKIIIDPASGGGSGSGVVPYLPLDQLQRRPAQTTQPTEGGQ